MPTGREPDTSKTVDVASAGDGRGRRAAYGCRWLAALLFVSIGLVAAVGAQAQTETAATQSTIGARTIFLMLFLMLGPIKILVPFVNMTRGSDAAFRRRLATRAVLYSAAALALAGLLGRTMLENFNVSIPVLALTGGVILFLVALQMVLQQSAGPTRPKAEEPPAGMHLAVNPLAFPIIVTPYGIAAVIVFTALAQDNDAAKLTVAGVVLAILVMDWLAMLFADVILRWLGTTLQVFAVVLGVNQIAIGLQVIFHNLSVIGVFVERAN